MIWHHHVRDDLVKPPDVLAVADGFTHITRNPGIIQPRRTSLGSLEFEVRGQESLSVSTGARRERSVEAEGNEKRGSIGLVMGQVSAVLHILIVGASPKYLNLSQAKACATQLHRSGHVHQKLKTRN